MYEIIRIYCHHCDEIIEQEYYPDEPCKCLQCREDC